MADRYWVGGTASWNGTAGTKWATTSGGAGGAAVPTSADDVYIDNNSGAVTVTVAASVNCKTLDFSGFVGTFAGSSDISCFGGWRWSAGMTQNFTGFVGFSATSGSFNITSNGIEFKGNIEFG